MSPETYYSLVAVHIVGVMAWMGTLASSLHTMAVHPLDGGSEGSAFIALERRTGIAMDASGVVAIVIGLILLFGTDFGDLHLEHGYMHAKLTAVVLIIGIHVYARIKMRKLRTGGATRPPVWLIGVLYALIIATVALITVGPAMIG